MIMDLGGSGVGTRNEDPQGSHTPDAIVTREATLVPVQALSRLRSTRAVRGAHRSPGVVSHHSGQGSI